MSRLRLAASALAVAGLLLAGLVSAQVQRTFVASYGNDANAATNCGFTNPCRGFTAAQAVTVSGGEVVALDAAGYGAITINRSITLTSNSGFYAGISASAGNAITIATGGVDVVIRGLNLTGVGGTTGINMTNGDSLTLDNVVISGFAGDGINVNSPGARVRIVNSLVRGNGVNGIYMQAGDADISNTRVLDNGNVGVWCFSSSGNSASVVATEVVASGNTWGFNAVLSAGVSSKMALIRVTASGNGFTGAQTEGGTISVAYSNLSNNGSYGLRNSTGTLESMNNNLVRGNPANTNGTITSIAGN